MLDARSQTPSALTSLIEAIRQNVTAKDHPFIKKILTEL